MKIKHLKHLIEDMNDDMEVLIEYDNGAEVELTEVNIIAPDELMINKYLLIK